MPSEFLKLTIEDRAEIFNEIFRIKNLNPIAVEKDWWVTQILHQVFDLEIADSLVFKGGTSLSKGWNLIERLSEDIDLALDRKYLGFDKEMGKNQVDKLRRMSNQFMREEFYPKLKRKIEDSGLAMLNVHFPENNQSDKDPQIIELYYASVIKNFKTYVEPRVLIEIGSRSLFEPFTKIPIGSMVHEIFPNREFADVPKLIPCVNVERTFLEKLFLLHEEFQKPLERIRSHRLSRHLYDLSQIVDTNYANQAISNQDLYFDIVKHRRVLTRINGLDYSKHAPRFLDPIPPDAVLHKWESDYKIMQEQMIYGKSLSFQELIQKLTQLKSKINALDWDFKP